MKREREIERTMGRKVRGEPVLSLSASADSTTPGQKAVLPSPPPAPITADDVPEFQEQTRQQKQANQMQVALQVIMIGNLIFHWFRGRNKPKPKKPRTPPSNN